MAHALLRPSHAWLVRRARHRLHSLCPPALSLWREKRHFLRTGEIELHLVPFLCRQERDAIDIGANEGAYLHMMIPHARRVMAFEPIPSLAGALKRKFGNRATIHDIALSHDAGTSILRIPQIGGEDVTGLASLSTPAGVLAGATREITVPTQPLDALYAGAVGFIKIDVEGHEDAVLDGAAETVARCRPRILVELEERHASGVIARNIDRFARIHYSGYYVHRRQLQPIENFDPAILQRQESIAGFAGTAPRATFGDYVNNFLFIPAEDCSAVTMAIASVLCQATSR